MNYVIELARRAARLRAIPLVALATLFGACNATDNLTSTSEVSDTPVDAPAAAEPTDVSLSSTFRGGIPFGNFRQPTTAYGLRYNGGMRTIWPGALVRELAAIKARGGRIVVNFAGNQRYYKDADGHFSFTKWKARVNQFRKINFSSYVKDGTIIGHYLVDEPNDKRNWNGRPIPPSTVEAMAKYSKQLWPGLTTIVRTWPAYLATWSGQYRYLDAAWAQYEIHRFPNVNDFINTNVSKARSKGLSLIMGLNVIHGGSRRRTEMTASQVRTYGSALLNSTYPCAFINWAYFDYYMNRSSVKDAMGVLGSKARSRSTKSCRSS